MNNIVLLVLIASSSVCAYADTYEAKYIAGSAPLTIDGSLDDWKWAEAGQAAITNYSPLAAEKTTPSAGDFSGWFMCIADDSNIYFAVQVSDDIVVTGNHAFGEGWKDDNVEVTFDGDLKNIAKPNFDANDGQIIVVGGPNGLAWLEGLVPCLVAQIPYYWDARGVRAGCKQSPGGYSVEIMIPVGVFGLKSIGGARIGLNVRVIDNDITDAGDPQGVLSWATDPGFTSSWKTDHLNQIFFSTKIDAPPVAGVTNKRTIAMSVGAQKMLVTLGAPDAESFETLIESVNEKLFLHDWDGAVAALSPIKEQIWAKSMLGAISMHKKDFISALAWLDDYAKNADDPLASGWARNYPYVFAQEMMFSQKLTFMYAQRPFAEAAYLLNEQLKINPNDNQAKDVCIQALKNINNGGGENVMILGELSREAVSKDIADQVKLALAKCYFFNGDYISARSAANEIIASFDVNDAIVFNAKMVIMSIELLYMYK